MGIISYAQNFEDVILYRALEGIDNGLYVDVGAQDPLIDSVSLAFHERGWRGVHVEPVPEYANRLRTQRPNDKVIQAVVSNSNNLIRFFAIANTGISTAEPSIAEEHRQNGFEIQDLLVPTVSLASVLDSNADEEIHWLKIDVEGHEAAVIESWGTSTKRPWIVIVESTLPGTRVESHDRWEARLLAFGYKHVYSDGLNRFYLSRTHLELLDKFACPPNVFDGFALNGTASAPFHYLLNERLNRQKSEAEILQADLHSRLEAEKQQADSSRTETEQLTVSLTSLRDMYSRLEQSASQSEREIEQLRLEKLDMETAHSLQLLEFRRESERLNRELVADLRNNWETQTRHQPADTSASDARMAIQNLHAEVAADRQSVRDLMLAMDRRLSDLRGSFEFQIAAARDMVRAETSNQMSEVMTRHNAEVARANSEIASLRVTLETVKSEIDSLADETRSMGSSFQAVRDATAILQGELASTSAGIERVRTDWSASSMAHAAQLAEDSGRVESILEGQAKKLMTLTSRITEIEDGEAAKIAAMEEGIARSRAALDQHVNTLGRETTGLASALKACRTEVDQCKARVSHAEAALGFFHGEEAKQREAFESRLRSELVALNDDGTRSLTTSIRDLAEHVDTTKNRLEALLSDSVAHVEALKIDFNGTRTDIDDTRQRVMELGQSIQSDLSALDDHINATLSKSFKRPPTRSYVTKTSSAVERMRLGMAPVAIGNQLAGSMANRSPDTFHLTANPIELAETSPLTRVDPKAVNLESMLGRHEEDFIRSAYVAVLGRQPDEDGMQYYLKRLREGTSKVEIMAQLHFSEEGADLPLPPLDIAEMLHRIGRERRPLVRMIQRAFAGQAVENCQNRELRMIELQVASLASGVTQKIRSLEHDVAQMQAEIRSDARRMATEVITAEPRSAATIQPDREFLPVVPKLESMSQNPPGLTGLISELKAITNEQSQRAT